MLALQSLMLRPQYQLVKSGFLMLTIGKSYCREIAIIATHGLCRGKGPSPNALPRGLL